MALNLPHMLSTSGLQPAAVGSPLARSAPLSKGGSDEPDSPSTHTARRTRIWELDGSLHCSIIGTCLTTAELRHILVKTGVGGIGAASDHGLHSLGVMLASRREGGAKFVQKTLDRRHHVAITRYSRAKDPVGLMALWEDSLEQGDIPGAYWAVLTHPVTTEDIVKRAFGDVHMLSHLVGAANRADIRRLRQLEQENAALAAKVERQQRQLRDGFAARDQALRRLNEMLAHQATDPCAREDDGAAADDLIRDLEKRLAGEIARREHAGRRACELAASLEERNRALQASRRECESTHHELALLERHLTALARPQAHVLEDMLDLSGNTILYVGGRAHQIAQLKGLVERVGARFLHHDGGIEHGSGLLPGLVSRADRVLFPIDCISHDAASTIKRVCRQTGRAFVPLRTASLTCLLSALMRTYGSGEKLAAE